MKRFINANKPWEARRRKQIETLKMDVFLIKRNEHWIKEDTFTSEQAKNNDKFKMRNEEWQNENPY
jgi:hypothetical protein